MARTKSAVVVTRKLPQAIETRLMELFEARLNPDDRPLPGAEIAAACQDSDVLVPTVTDRIDRAVIAALPERLRLIANFGVGIDHIDLAAATERRILVTNTPGVLTEDTADLTVALLLAAPRRLVEGDRLVRAGRWTGWTPTFMLGHRIAGKRLGIIGMGRIGRAVARRVHGFGMSIHYHNRHRLDAELEAELEATWWGSLDQMLAHMDFVSVNCPQTAETFHLLDDRRLALLPAHAFVINTSRGGVIDEAALARRLAAGQLGGAALDVYEREPAVTEALLGLDNVVLAPHLGSATLEGRIAMGERVLLNIKAFVDGHAPPDRVLPHPPE